MWPYYLVVLGVLVAGAYAMAFIANARQRKRARALAAAAEHLGLAFDAELRLREPPQEASFRLRRPLLANGARNFLTGSWRGVNVRVFDRVFMWWQEEPLWLFLGAESRRTHVAVELDHELPRLTIRPRNWLRSLLSHIGDSGYVIPPAAIRPVYCVATDNPAFAAGVLHPRMIELLRAHPGFTIRVSGRGLTVTRRTLLAPDEIEAALTFAAEIRAQIPDDVKKDYART